MNNLFLKASLSLAIATIQIWSVMAHSAIDPVPRQESWWQERHQLLNRRAAEAGPSAQIIFIGDSITQGWEGEGKETWSRFYAHRGALNLGISGDRTQHVLWRLDHGNLDGLKPKAAVVMIGTNNSNGEDNTSGQIADGVAAIIEKLRGKLPETKVLLLAIFPRSENFSSQRGKILQANQVLRKLADDQHVFWIDFGHHFLNRDGLIPGVLMPDYLHLSKRGYALWAESIEAPLARVLGDQLAPSRTSGSPDRNGE
jgi:lysophospholipase L1-like esterase